MSRPLSESDRRYLQGFAAGAMVASVFFVRIGMAVWRWSR